MVPHADGLRKMRAIYIDAGKRDEWFLDLGAEAFRRALNACGVTDVFFNLFDATHMEAGAFPDDLKSAGEERMTGGGASRPGRVDAQGGVADLW